MLNNNYTANRFFVFGKEVNESEVKNDSKKKNNWLIVSIGIVIVVLIIILLLHSCNGKKYKITLHYGDDTIEVDKNFKLSDLEVEGGTISFLVDSDGHIVLPGEKLDSKKEYSAHIIPEGKKTVKVTYKVDGKSRTVTGSGCGNNPWVKGSLNNGSNDTISLKYEDTLTFTVKDSSGKVVNPTDGVYKGNNLTISTNISATISGNYLSSDSGSLRKSASTTGASDTTVTIKTPCGQTKTVIIEAIIF